MNRKWEIASAARRLYACTIILCTSSCIYCSLFLIIIIIVPDVIMRTGNVEERSETRRTRKLIRFKIMIMKTSRHDGCHRTRSRCGHTTDVSDDSCTPPTDLQDYSKTISPQVNTYNSLPW